MKHVVSYMGIGSTLLPKTLLFDFKIYLYIFNRDTIFFVVVLYTLLTVLDIILVNYFEKLHPYVHISTYNSRQAYVYLRASLI